MAYKIVIQTRVNENYAWETLGESEVALTIEDFEVASDIPWELICSGLVQAAVNKAARAIAKRNQEEDEGE
jgi:hypothetical protein